ncbi:hypothetical protein [Halpernia sp. GG3]
MVAILPKIVEIMLSEIITNLIQSVELVSVDNQNWTKSYFDKNLNESWLSYYVNTINRKNIIGKSQNQIEFDNKYYKEIAERANKL